MILSVLLLTQRTRREAETRKGPLSQFRNRTPFPPLWASLSGAEALVAPPVLWPEARSAHEALWRRESTPRLLGPTEL